MSVTRVLALALLAAALPLGCSKKHGGGGAPPPPAPPPFNIARGFNDEVLAVAAAADASGDIYLGGTFACFGSTKAGSIIRLNANGTVDGAFATGTGFNGPVHAILALGNGDIVVGGIFS